MNKAVILDRDGVICEDTHYITNFNKLHIFSFAAESVHIMHEKGYKVIVVSNQSAVAREMMNENDVIEINNHIKNETGVDKIYYCPHLPPESDEREKFPYRIYCSCRKPEIGMIMQAKKEFNIDLKKSYMVGDRNTDILAGKKAGMQTIYIKNEQNSRCDIKSNMEFCNIYDFAKQIK
ncbi:D-glycero-alpha-D-manno-heptose-1,7-bisphosphate 7-phosphatase [Clostridium neonatale]|uniref:D-glycero-alpha-D-manno-heptose-1,7-bisphosphate 7-phosphatase n=1 Tax=Clostridium neonatale TaxID=137838 RepID=UPI00291BFF8F|nr:D,D-heptose 1,7-bisphosphate phosphatase [Clostridium neonatale]